MKAHPSDGAIDFWLRRPDTARRAKRSLTQDPYMHTAITRETMDIWLMMENCQNLNIRPIPYFSIPT
ncbi:hypothetical protein T06_9537 [Trichinella sp. T6]|nr:hypothetical protein T06_9537 [Trichinella sp. T6]